MADMGCSQELNAQIQALQTRLRSLEVTTMVQSLLLRSIGQIVNTIISAVEALGGAVLGPIGNLINLLDLLVGDVSAIQAVVESVLSGNSGSVALPALGDIFDALMIMLIQIAMNNLAIPGFVQAYVDSFTANITGQITNLEAELLAATDPAIIAELTSKLQQVHNIADSITGFFSHTNNMSLCKTSSMDVHT